MGAYTHTLADARANTSIRNVAGKCASTAEFAELINRATRRLLKRGAWWGTEVVMQLCVYGCTIVWPRYVGTIAGVRFCCGGQVDIKNNWYSILGPRGNYAGYGDFRSDVTMVDDGTSPVFNEITGNTGNFLRYHIVKNNDVGQNITFFGKQYGAQPLQEQDADGNWIPGLTLAAATPVAQTTTLVTQISNITREATQGMTYLYGYEPVSGDLRMLGSYEPNETNPRYRRSKVQNMNRIFAREDDNGRKVWRIEALVKLEYIEATNDRDFLIVDDFDALTFAIQSIKFDEAQDPQNAEIYLMKAIAELNFESRNKNPGQNFVVKSRVMGSNRVISNFV